MICPASLALQIIELARQALLGYNLNVPVLGK